MPKLLLNFVLAAAVSSIGYPAFGTDVSKLNVGDALPRAGMLKPETHRYLRYIIKGDARETLDIWERLISRETVDDRSIVRIRQRWDGVSSKIYTRSQDSTFDARTFAPLTHLSTVTRDGTTKVSAFLFEPSAVLGDPKVSGNDASAFRIDLKERVYNFETDMELFQMLPLAKGFSVNLPFYDPGLSPPARYTFTVTRDAVITGFDGRPVDCWIMESDYNKPGHTGRFWIAKRNQVVIRYETELPDGGGRLVKALLPPEE